MFRDVTLFDIVVCIVYWNYYSYYNALHIVITVYDSLNI